MSEKFKSISLLLASIFIGIIIGALVMRYFVNRSAHRMMLHGPSKMIERTVKKTTKPTEEQKLIVDKALMEFRDRFHENKKSFRDSEKENLNQLIEELEQILDEEQFEKLQVKFAEMKERREFHERKHKKYGPGPK